jgi:methionyl-tRNA formyltransferase
MRCVFAGTPEPAAVCLAALLASAHEVVAVLTRPDRPSGRGRTLTASPVAQLAVDHGIEVLRPESARDPELASRLTALAPDAVPVVAYGALIRPPLLDLPPHGWINLHFSVLPQWRGAAPVQHAIWHGDEVTGATTFRLDEGMDTGPVLGTLTEEIGPRDTSGELLDRLARSGAGLLVATLDLLERGELVAIAQTGGASYAPKLTVDDARIRWDVPAIAVDRHVRACTPAPGAWTMLGDDRLRLGPVTVSAEQGPLAAGCVRVGRDAVLVGTATTPVALGDVTAPGRRAMSALDWARGARIGADGVLR